MIQVGELAPAGCWDSNMLRLLFDGELYPHRLEFKRVAGYPNTNAPVILVVPGRYWHEVIHEVNAAIRRYKGVLFIRTADEEDLFDVGKLFHPNLKCWVQTPRTDRDYKGARRFGVGFPPHFNSLSSTPPDKVWDVFLSAQATHTRRLRAFEALKGFPDSRVEATGGFTQGLPAAEYAEAMCAARVAPCPSGAVSPDSFRLWEALEAHCVPIADDVSPQYRSEGFWRSLFDTEPPFPILRDSHDYPGYARDMLADYPARANRVAAWWMRLKREMTLWLEADLKALAAL